MKPLFNLEHTDERVVLMIRDRLGVNHKVTLRVRLNRKPIYGLYFSNKEDLTKTLKFIAQIGG